MMAAWRCILLVAALSQAAMTLPSWRKSPTDQEVRLHQNVTIFCEFGDLDPGMTVIWQNSTQVLFVNRARHHAPSRFTLIEDSSGQRLNLMIRDVRREDDDQYQCSVPGLLKSAQLTVIVGPQKPVVNIESSAELTSELAVNLTCSSNGGNPPPRVNWYRNGRQITGGDYLVEPETKFGTTVSVLAWTLAREDHNATFVCSVENKGNSGSPIYSKREVLNVQYIPLVRLSPPGPLRVMENDDLTVTCNVDANPPAHMVTWYRNGQPQMDLGRTYTIRRADRTQHSNMTLGCLAQNHIGGATISTIVQVLYAPELVIRGVNADHRIYVRESVSVTLRCDVQASPPATSIWWQKSGHTHLVTGDSLHINKVNRKHGGVYTCGAMNRLLPSGRAQRVGKANATVELVVQYPPGQASIQLNAKGQEKVEGHPVKGQSISLHCRTETPGNPVARFVWTKVGDDAFRVDGAVVDFDDIKLSSSGIYKCTAINAMGTGKTAAYQLEVRDGPSFVSPILTRQKTMKITDVGQSITCAVTGNPLPTVTWFRDGRPIERDSDRFSVSVTEEALDQHQRKVSSLLRWTGSERSPRPDSLHTGDSGNYTCVASNGVKADISQSVHVQVQYLPEVRALHAYGKVAVDLHQSISLLCQGHSLPQPDIEWYHEARRLVKSDQVFISTSHVTGQYSHQSVLTLSSVKVRDLGQYKCVARNELGAKAAFIQLQLRSVPDPVRHLKVTNVSSYSVGLRWQLAFDGGYPQSFMVVTTSAQKAPIEETVSSTTGTHRVDGLRPATRYTFMVYSKNQLGTGGSSMTVTMTTKVAIVMPPTNVKYDINKQLLTFSAFTSHYCSRVLVRYHDNMDTWQEYRPCAPSSGGSMKLSTSQPISQVNVSLCLQESPRVCSHGVLAVIDGSAPGGPSGTLIIVVAGICGVVVVGLVLLLAVLCCRRRSHGNKASSIKKSYAKNENISKKNQKLSPNEYVSYDMSCDKNSASQHSPGGSHVALVQDHSVEADNAVTETKSFPGDKQDECRKTNYNQPENQPMKSAIFYHQESPPHPSLPASGDRPLYRNPPPVDTLAVHWSPSIDSCIEYDSLRDQRYPMPDVTASTNHSSAVQRESNSNCHQDSHRTLSRKRGRPHEPLGADLTVAPSASSDLNSSQESYPVLDLMSSRREHKHDTHSQSSEESGYATPTSNLRRVVHEVVV